MIPPAESRPDWKISPAPGTNQIAGFVQFLQLGCISKNEKNRCSCCCCYSVPLLSLKNKVNQPFLLSKKEIVDDLMKNVQ